MKPPNRMFSETVSFLLGGQHSVSINIGRSGATGEVVEIAICEGGKLGTHLQLLLAELGLKISRAIQFRDPETGAEVVSVIDQPMECERQ